MKKFYLAIIPVIFWMNGECDVILTGIMDGTLAGGKPKAIELFIAGTEDLGGYEIWRSQNGDPFGAGLGSIAALSGTYTNTFVYLVKTDHVAEFHSVFGSTGFYANVIPLAIVSGNGNEGYQIRDTVGDVVIDQVWLEDPTDSYRDSYWYRTHGTGPDGTWLATCWESPGNDVLDNLDEEGLRASVPFGSYAIAWNGFSSAWDDVANWAPAIVPGQNCNVLVMDTAAIFPVIMNPVSSPAECFNLTLRDSARLTVAPGKALTVFGNLSLTGASPPDKFLLKSDSSNIPGGSVIIKGAAAGQIMAERYIPADNSWHFLASPVTGQSIQPGFAPVPLDNTFDLYAWQESMPLAAGWMNIRDTNGNLNSCFDNFFLAGKGYLAAYSPQYSGTTLKSFYGNPDFSNTEFPLSHAGNFWNLLGNPYTCAVDWSSPGIDKSLVAGGAMYIWDQSLNAGAGGYRTHNGSVGVPAGSTPVIPAMNGFFIQSLDSGNMVMDISDGSVLVHDPQGFYKSTTLMTEERVRLRISRGNFNDEALILFDPDALNGYDPLLDALKLSNGLDQCPEISSVAPGDHTLIINTLGSFPVSVPLSISFGHSDTLQLTAFDFEFLDPVAGIFLEDTQLGIIQDLREDPVYRFLHVVPGTPQRFVLHFMDLTGVEEEGQAREISVYSYAGMVYITGSRENDVNYTLFDISGRSVSKGILNECHDFSRLPAGIYIIHVYNKGSVYRQKIIL